MTVTEADKDQIVRLTATLMAATAALALRWAGNAMLVLAGVLLIIEYAANLDLMDTGLALTPTAFWVAAWVTRKARDRIADRVVASTRPR